MLASDIMADVRARLSESSEDFWYNTELLAWIDQAQKKVQTIIPHLRKSAEDTSVIAQQEYDNPAGYASMIAVSYDSKFLIPAKFEELKQQLGDNLLTDSGTPIYYYEGFAGKIGVTPIPDTAAITIKFWYYYIPITITAVGDTIEVDEQYREVLVKYTLQNALYKQEDYEAGILFKMEAEEQIESIREKGLPKRTIELKGDFSRVRKVAQREG